MFVRVNWFWCKIPYGPKPQVNIVSDWSGPDNRVEWYCPFVQFSKTDAFGSCRSVIFLDVQFRKKKKSLAHVNLHKSIQNPSERSIKIKFCWGLCDAQKRNFKKLNFGIGVWKQFNVTWRGSILFFKITPPYTLYSAHASLT